MKTIVLIIALVGFGITGSFAQNKNCCCRKMAVHHKTTRHRYAAKAVHKDKPAAYTYETQIEPCFTYRKDNIVVSECPDMFYNNDNSLGGIGFIQEGNYTGYYPATTMTTPAASEALPANFLAVSSPAFKNYGPIPAKYTCEGDHASPPLTIGHIPHGTQSLALIMYDPEATIPIKSASNSEQTVTYWMAWNIDTAGNIPENYISNHQSINDSKSWGYEAICPVAGTHYYHFAVYALNTKLRAGRHSTKASLERDMAGHVLARGELIGIYNRHLE